MVVFFYRKVLGVRSEIHFALFRFRIKKRLFFCCQELRKPKGLFIYVRNLLAMERKELIPDSTNRNTGKSFHLKQQIKIEKTLSELYPADKITKNSQCRSVFSIETIYNLNQKTLLHRGFFTILPAGWYWIGGITIDSLIV